MARRSGLGKGLSSLIPNEIVVERDVSLVELPVGSIQPNSFQPRSEFGEDAMATLVASIKELGVLQPILVRVAAGSPPEAPIYELIAGERRWRASKRAGLQTIPAVVHLTTTDAHSLEQALVENLHREDLNAIEEALGYQQLIDDFGLTHDQVATRVGKSRVSVTNTLRLLQLPPRVQRALADQQITAGHAKALLSTDDQGLQEALVLRIASENLSVRVLESILKGGGEEPATTPATETASPETAAAGQTKPGTAVSGTGTKPRPLPEPGVLELEDLLSNHLNTRVKVDLQNRKGRVVVEFATLEDLERIYRAMVGEA
ncbi:MAG: ParB/RepB/Spo0J family partition protein [Actinomycetota bacterium]